MPQKCISRNIKVIQSISKLIKECNYYNHKRTLLIKNKRKKRLAVKRKQTMTGNNDKQANVILVNDLDMQGNTWQH